MFCCRYWFGFLCYVLCRYYFVGLMWGLVLFCVFGFKMLVRVVCLGWVLFVCVWLGVCDLLCCGRVACLWFVLIWILVIMFVGFVVCCLVLIVV